MFLNLGVSTWANTYLGSIGYETVQAAGVMSIYSIGGIIGSLLTGIIVKKFNMNVKFYLIGVYILIAVVTLIFGFQTNLGILKAAGFVYGFATYLPNAHLNALITKYAPDHLAGSVMGVQNCIFQMASILSPMVVGWTVDLTGTFRTCWFALAVMPVIGLAFLFILREQREEYDIKKENVLKLYRHEMPEYLPIMGRVSSIMFRSAVIWNGQPAAGMAMTGSECTGCGKRGAGACPGPDFLLKDIADWREIVKFPDLDQFDWEQAAKRPDFGF